MTVRDKLRADTRFVNHHGKLQRYILKNPLTRSKYIKRAEKRILGKNFGKMSVEEAVMKGLCSVVDWCDILEEEKEKALNEKSIGADGNTLSETS